ncbi:family 2 encapsulin nanocompartment cargo protein polyprenyl transferase [Actinomadura kijaniata]|uniref:Geranylgeranyl diphosphate synthase type I n=1 Tax=Actinomadura namibiensis TaxID=182080 RepID=A0A7W3LPW0_ACTNM|nr:polyprenyl synthetase family protein [Actinomadura namibiensis]MBA8952098.1 geranylgeranyl diphosphate synthase type I [Actinomadura namibiensis]
MTTSTQTATFEAAESLARCRDLVQPALRATVGALDRDLEMRCGFALGWWDSDGRADGHGTGKGLRPALALLGAQAVGAPPDTVVAGAVAVELVHVFSLAHDDIMDGDERRRHRPSLWKAYGVGTAVLTGDALLALALGALAEAPGERHGEAARLLARMLLDLVGGQAADVAFEDRPWTGPRAVTLAEYRHMAVRKTGALLGCSAAIGAALAGAPAGVVAGLEEAGRHLGLAFQAVDDVLGIWGDPSVTGKPAFGDLRRGKKTVPVLTALADPRGGDRLAELLSGERTGPEVRQAAALVAEAGGRAAAERMARHHLDAAVGGLRGLGLAEPAAAELIAVARSLADRRQ